MSVSAVAFHRRQLAPPAEDSRARERWARRRIGLSWCLLLLNVLVFYPGTWNGLPLVVPIPTSLGKLITQGALPLALLVTLTVNRRLLIRPNVFLCIASLLVVGALMAMAQPEHFGTVYRTVRLAGFVATLWLLTPWWGRRDLLLLRCHLGAIAIILGSVLLGVLAAPSTALSQGRLSGTLWPLPPTDVAHFSAVMTGLVVVLWFCGKMRGRVALPIALVATTILLLTHTRTALVGMLAGILVAGLSLVLAKARVRKLFVAGGALVLVGLVTFSSAVTHWLDRGEGTQQLSSLTGRTSVWSAVVTDPRDKFEVIFGFGLSNKSFNGLPIDSNWLAAYLDLGLFGVCVCAAILLFLLVSAYFQPRGAERALALFLITYCLLSSFTETGLSDASIYLLEVTLAASMLVPSLADRDRPVSGADADEAMPVLLGPQRRRA